MYKDVSKQREWQRNWQLSQRLKRKLAVLEMLGGCCASCGYKENICALQIDHKEPLRRKNRTLVSKTSGSNLWRNVYNGSIPLDTVQLLCANCHCIKTHEVDRPTYKKHRK